MRRQQQDRSHSHPRTPPRSPRARDRPLGAGDEMPTVHPRGDPLADHPEDQSFRRVGGSHQHQQLCIRCGNEPLPVRNYLLKPVATITSTPARHRRHTRPHEQHRQAAHRSRSHLRCHGLLGPSRMDRARVPDDAGDDRSGPAQGSGLERCSKMRWPAVTLQQWPANSCGGWRDFGAGPSLRRSQ
jgi:hypothetical protein